MAIIRNRFGPTNSKQETRVVVVWSTMGKIRRARQKYHLASVRLPGGAERDEKVPIAEAYPSTTCTTGGWKVWPSDNIFEGLDIDVSTLNTTLLNFDSMGKRQIEDDEKSLGGRSSISKMLKLTEDGKVMKKEDRRKLRHALFIQKIDSVYKQMEERSKGPKVRKGMDKAKQDGVKVADKAGRQQEKMKITGESDRDGGTPAVTGESGGKHPKVDRGREGKVRRKKGIQKATVRCRNMLNDIESFKKILVTTSKQITPLDAIKSKVEEKDPDILWMNTTRAFSPEVCTSWLQKRSNTSRPAGITFKNDPWMSANIVVQDKVKLQESTLGKIKKNETMTSNG
ncbi:hypothetical protein AAG570_004790 [Ranatra chinensis]|uniref:Uncharacterized protein n=1 Tax=Ranatra chinensis TaxID=642074 RepID=A0ABD0Y397_9HEMI